MTPFATRVPWHRSLFVRVFGIGALIAVVAVAAATWATVRSTTVAVQEEQRESLHADARAYDALVGYAATHRGWAGAADLVGRLARDTGQRVVVTDVAGRVLVDSGGDEGRLRPDRARAELDPLSVDGPLVATAQEEPGASPSPVTAPAEQQSPVDDDRLVACAREFLCESFPVAPTIALDRRIAGPLTDGAGSAWRDLVRGVDACLGQSGLDPLAGLTESFVALVRYPERHRRVAACVEDGVRTALAPYVAPPALLFLGGGETPPDVFWDLSRDAQVRIGLLAGSVLVLTLLLCAVLAGTVARPLRRMATAARRAGEGDLAARVPTSARRRDEVGEVGRAFNAMAARREQLEDARRRLVSDVSHELRTPLANVRGWLEAAQDGLVEPDGALLSSLHEETLHLQRLVDDLHDLALADAGELRLDPTSVELDVFLDQVASGFRAAAVAAGVDLRVEAGPAATVDADPVRLRQAVTNVVANALRHTPSGGEVVLRGRPGEVEVADTGTGIPAEEVPHVFDRFRRADPSRSRATGGSGLGLAIVRQIAEAHGGEATLTSTPGVGTAVVLRLPHDRSSTPPT